MKNRVWYLSNLKNPSFGLCHAVHKAKYQYQKPQNPTHMNLHKSSKLEMLKIILDKNIVIIVIFLILNVRSGQ